MKLKLSFLFTSILLFTACSKDGNINVFSVQDDINFGAQLDSSILLDPTEYPILSPNEYPEAYEYLNNIMNLILSSDEIYHKDVFPWQVRIVDRDILNAFAAPGGYVYFYTGFMKYAGSEAELAGVMAHEIAHADLRHSTESLTKEYGLSTLFSILIGKDAGQLKQIASEMALGGASLKFSRTCESQADEYSVRYLESVSNSRNYQPTSIIDFFERMQRDSLSEADGSFQFLRTHPYDDNRKENVNKIWAELGSPAGEKFEDNHKKIVATLP